MRQKQKISFQGLLGLLSNYKTSLIVGAISMIIHVACWPILAWLAGKLIPAIGEGDTKKVLLIVLQALLIFFIQKISQFSQDISLAKPSLFVSQELRKILFQKLQKIDILALGKLSTGDLTYRLTQDADKVAEVIYKTIHDTTPSILQLIAVITYMFFLDWQISIATILLAPLISILVSNFGERVLKASEKSQQQISTLASLIGEAIQGLSIVKAFAVENWLQKRFDKEVELHRIAKYKSLKLIALQHPIIGLIEAAGILTILIIGTFRINYGGLTNQEFGSYFAALLMLIDPISHITTNFNELKQGQASIKRLNTIAIQKTELSSNNEINKLKDIKGNITFKNVFFSYDKESEVLKDININFDSGEMIALVGPSGSGKSTIFSLLLKFIRPENGSILIDDYDISKIKTSTLRNEIGLVPQKNYIFSGTISDAITFGREASKKNIIKAAKIANAHDFIINLPCGYDTEIEERGVNLSGGQIQRLAIARALLGNPSILLLDEATSALDADAEEAVKKGLKQAMIERTVLIIAHRLSTVQEADKIVLIENGMVKGIGSHNNLFNTDKKYRELCKKQFINSI